MKGFIYADNSFNQPKGQGREKYLQTINKYHKLK